MCQDLLNRAFRRSLSKHQVESPGYPRDKPLFETKLESVSVVLVVVIVIVGIIIGLLIHRFDINPGINF